MDELPTYTVVLPTCGGGEMYNSTTLHTYMLSDRTVQYRLASASPFRESFRFDASLSRSGRCFTYGKGRIAYRPWISKYFIIIY